VNGIDDLLDHIADECKWSDWGEVRNRVERVLRPQLEAADALADAVKRFVHPQNIPDALQDYLAARDAHFKEAP
jgi:hypothetical protein